MSDLVADHLHTVAQATQAQSEPSHREAVGGDVLRQDSTQHERHERCRDPRADAREATTTINTKVTALGASKQRSRVPKRSMSGAQRNFNTQGAARSPVKPMADSDTPCSRNRAGNALGIRPEGSPCAKYRQAKKPSRRASVKMASVARASPSHAHTRGFLAMSRVCLGPRETGPRASTRRRTTGATPRPRNASTTRRPRRRSGCRG
jgi:hypothetical protein